MISASFVLSFLDGREPFFTGMSRIATAASAAATEACSAGVVTSATASGVPASARPTFDCPCRLSALRSGASDFWASGF